MFKKLTAASVALLCASTALAQNTPINGTVQSRCIIQTDEAGLSLQSPGKT